MFFKMIQLKFDLTIMILILFDHNDIDPADLILLSYNTFTAPFLETTAGGLVASFSDKYIVASCSSHRERCC